MKNQMRQHRTRLQNLAERISILTAICTAAAMASPAATFTVVRRFNGTNGSGPVAPPVEGLDLNLYGTTNNGGASNYGTVFKLTPRRRAGNAL
jgi:uncharacterized repeat protein (TIGR03803 family)